MPMVDDHFTHHACVQGNELLCKHLDDNMLLYLHVESDLEFTLSIDTLLVCMQVSKSNEVVSLYGDYKCGFLNGN